MSIQTLRYRKFRSWRSEPLRRKLNNRKWSCCWGIDALKCQIIRIDTNREQSLSQTPLMVCNGSKLCAWKWCKSARRAICKQSRLIACKNFFELKKASLSKPLHRHINIVSQANQMSPDLRWRLAQASESDDNNGKLPSWIFRHKFNWSRFERMPILNEFPPTVFMLTSA